MHKSSSLKSSLQPRRNVVSGFPISCKQLAVRDAIASVIAGRAPAIDISSQSGSRFFQGRRFGSASGPGNRE